MKLFNKGAMFGLDARIALAIFGALSVISGAALYSAIATAKNTQFVTSVTEIQKAMEAYILDTGSLPDFSVSNFIDSNELVTSTKQGWSGPYIPRAAADLGATCTDCALDGTDFPHDGLGVFGFWGQKEDAATASGLSACTSGVDCFLWIGFLYTSLEQAQTWDTFVDGSSDPKTGSVRLHQSSNPARYYVYNKTGINIDQVK